MSDDLARRRSERVALQGEVRLRRFGSLPYHTQIFDLSPLGCRVEFVERPDVSESVWVRLPGLEPLEAEVRWIEGFAVGVQFMKPLHQAVFERLVASQ